MSARELGEEQWRRLLLLDPDHRHCAQGPALDLWTSWTEPKEPKETEVDHRPGRRAPPPPSALKPVREQELDGKVLRGDAALEGLEGQEEDRTGTLQLADKRHKRTPRVSTLKGTGSEAATGAREAGPRMGNEAGSEADPPGAVESRATVEAETQGGNSPTHGEKAEVGARTEGRGVSKLKGTDKVTVGRQTPTATDLGASQGLRQVRQVRGSATLRTKRMVRTAIDETKRAPRTKATVRAATGETKPTIEQGTMARTGKAKARARTRARARKAKGSERSRGQQHIQVPVQQARVPASWC